MKRVHHKYHFSFMPYQPYYSGTAAARFSYVYKEFVCAHAPYNNYE